LAKFVDIIGIFF